VVVAAAVAADTAGGHHEEAVAVFAPRLRPVRRPSGCHVPAASPCRWLHGQQLLIEETAMKKLIVLVALAFTLIAGTTAVVTVYPQQAHADGCAGANC
jgi:hypothetical protein